jgi:hypothetical protein
MANGPWQVANGTGSNQQVPPRWATGKCFFVGQFFVKHFGGVF